MLLGLALGIFGTWLTTRFLEAYLFGVKPLDPVVLFSSAMIVIVGCLVMSAIPAGRAARVEPASLLRQG